jgi:uncharacterized small protein (DUF1192 family)
MLAEHLKNAKPSAFPRIDRLEKHGSYKDVDFVFIPKQESKSKTIELVVTDPISGIHIVKEGRADYLEFRTDLVDEDKTDFAEDDFGRVQSLAFNHGKDMLALYCNPELTGRIVLLRNLRQEIARIECTETGGS